MYKDKKQFLLKYNPYSGGKLELTCFTTATCFYRKIIFSNAYVNKIDLYNFKLQCAGNQEERYFEKTVYKNETDNPKSDGYLASDKKEILLENCEIINSGTVELGSRYRGSIEDFLPIKLAQEINGVVFIADYHEATNAYYYNVPFFYLLSGEQMKVIRKEGQRFFNGEFIKKIKI